MLFLNQNISVTSSTGWIPLTVGGAVFVGGWGVLRSMHNSTALLRFVICLCSNL